MSLAKKVAPIPVLSDHRKAAERDAWICERLRLPHLFAGITSTEIRRDRLKVVLLERGLTESIAGTRDGKPITWRALFEEHTGENLA
ncbi:MAG TPA: hypothetical protein VNU21_18295 [Usitatibacter sp.]|nr:hypothetical protein [Usitatibacter sp.]